jgi:hypothetical protein
MGHASAVTTLTHYAHVFDEARLAPATPTVDAIRAARAQIEEERLRESCAPPSEGGSYSNVPIAQISLFSSDFPESGRRDSNPRPSAWKADALAN